MSIDERFCSKFAIGDRVQYAVRFLRSTGQYHGDPAPTSCGPFAKGKIVRLSPVPKTGREYPQTARILWDDGRESCSLVSNLDSTS